MANVSLAGIRKTYPNGAVAVRGVDMTIEDGEFIVFVGPSGCGKSTLLRMVAGLETVTAGSIHIGDRLINDVSPADRDVAMVFQNYALYPHMTVRGNMSYGLKNRKLPKDEINKKVTETANLLRIGDYLDRAPNELSGGQRQRVAMGRAIVREPKVFLFDEPLSNLDAKLRVQMRIEIKRLQRRLNVTSIYVTHDQTEAMTLADRLAVINDGKIEQMGAPIELYNNPATLFVATFIGSPQINLLPAQFDGKNLISNGLSLAGFEGLPTSKELRQDDHGQLEMRVDLVEQHGADNLIYGAIMNSENTDNEETEFCFKTGQEVMPDLETTLKLGFDPDRTMLFDKESGDRLR
jgi:sn-glycerol 3-phosphate transport system ATP-binding protein